MSVVVGLLKCCLVAGAVNVCCWVAMATGSFHDWRRTRSLRRARAVAVVHWLPADDREEMRA
jgi:tellurite resistance protein